MQALKQALLESKSNLSIFSDRRKMKIKDIVTEQERRQSSFIRTQDWYLRTGYVQDL